MSIIGSWVREPLRSIYVSCPEVTINGLDAPSPTPGLHVIIGPVGSGKTTVAKALCNTAPGLIYGGDPQTFGTEQMDTLLDTARTARIILELQSLTRDNATAAAEIRSLLDRARRTDDVQISVVGINRIRAATRPVQTPQ